MDGTALKHSNIDLHDTQVMPMFIKGLSLEQTHVLCTVYLHVHMLGWSW